MKCVYMLMRNNELIKHLGAFTSKKKALVKVVYFNKLLLKRRPNAQPYGIKKIEVN